VWGLSGMPQKGGEWWEVAELLRSWALPLVGPIVILPCPRPTTDSGAPDTWNWIPSEHWS